jgi:bile acid-coenzyme A ligase
MEEVTTIVERLSELAATLPADEVICTHLSPTGEERSMTAAQLDRRSSQLAAAMKAKGVGLGDRVGLGLRNSPELVLAAFAAWKVGATPIPVRWDLPDWELARLREVVGASLYLTDDDVSWVRATELDDVPELPEVMSPRMVGICSSGSTGTPKIIVSGWPAVYLEITSTPMLEIWRAVPRPQVVLVLAPMYHVNAFITLQNMLAGDRIVVLETFDAGLAVDAIGQHGATTFTATPTMLQRMADLPGVRDRDLSSLEWILQGAAPMPASLVRRWADLIGAERIVMAYGMTEGIGVTALTGDEWMAHEGSVGRGIRETEVRILDEDGAEVPVGEVGEIFMHSPSYGGSDYLGDAPQLRTTPDGFQTVGDMGHVDDDGYLYIADRRVDMIVTGGANVFPAQVEEALIDHPAIADVVVVGLADADWGRRVHAIVEPADPAAPPSEDEVIAYAKSRLAAYKVPKTVEFIDAMPRSAATKVNRGRLVEARGG